MILRAATVSLETVSARRCRGLTDREFARKMAEVWCRPLRWLRRRSARGPTLCLSQTSQAAIRGELCLPVECDFIRSRDRPKPPPAEACSEASMPRRLRPDGALFSERSRPDSKRSDCASSRQPSAFETEYSLIRSARGTSGLTGCRGHPVLPSFRAARFCKNRRAMRPAALPLGGWA